MSAPTTPQEAYDAAVLGPKSVQKNGHGVVGQDLDQLARAADREEAKASAVANRPGLGIRIQKIVPYYP